LALGRLKIREAVVSVTNREVARTPITIEVRNSLSQPVIELDLTEFKKDIKSDLKNYMDQMMEKMTPPGELKSLTEKKAPVEFDYRQGIIKRLGSFKERIGLDDYKYEDIKKVATPKYDEKAKTTSYTLNESLIETIGTVDPSCCIPEIWADKIERDHVYPGSVFLGAWFVNWYDEIEGKPGDKVHICSVGPATCVDLTCDEPTSVAATVDCPYITLQEDACAYTICRADIEDVQVGLVDALNEGLGSCLAVCIDNYFFNIALSCTNGGTLTSTGPMTGSLILEAMGSMLAGTYTPVKLIMHPVPWTSLMQDTNFRYANQFGARDVITSGRLDNAFGIEINVTPKGTLTTGGGTYRSLLLAKGALAGALKHGITVESEYSPRFQKRWVIADIRYGGKCLHPDGIWWIRTVETP